MALEPGSRLGHYDVTDLLGEGGMGQVWQATDTQLNRQVALKILPDAFAADPDRLARFKREARILASLNHPNIAAIYGIEEAEGTRALVLELVEGPTLADRISKGPIPLDEALPIAKQIAEALEAAHEQGVIHRDLKPANIKVKDDGTVKVLDFGLAKAFQPDVGDASASMSPTISLTAAATQMGMVIGTAAYMAPEQAKGRVVDKRVDVWAFGAVVYEMLMGTRAFIGDDVSDTLAAVLRAEVDLEGLPEETPPRLRQVLRACLQRDPKQRVHDVADVRLAIEGAFESTASTPSEQVVTPQLQVWQRPVPAAAAVLAALVVGGEPEVLTTVDPESEETDHRWPEVLPNGNAVVFTAWSGSTESSRIAVLSLETGEVSYLLRGGSNPHYSPTGHIVYGMAGTLWALGFDAERLNNNPVPVDENVGTKVNGAVSFSIAGEGALIYVRGEVASEAQRTLVWVDREGREEPLSLPPRAYTRVAVSPDGARAAVVIEEPDNNDVWTSELARGTLIKVTTDPANDDAPLWTPDGQQLVFSSNRDGLVGLFLKAADGRGDVEQLVTLEGVLTVSAYDWSPDGTELIFPGKSGRVD